MANGKRATLERVDQKLDDLILVVREIKESLDKHADRIGSLERWRSWMVGVGSAISGYLTFLR